MSDLIQDGKGRGFRAGVNSRNELLVMANTSDIRHFTNHQKQKSFYTVVQQTPSAPNTCFMYIKNLDVQDLTIWKFDFKVSAAEVIEIYGVPTGTPSGTAYNPVNPHVSSGVVADCTMLIGNNITGLTKDPLKLLKRFYVPANSISNEFILTAGIILDQNISLACYAVNGSIQVDMMMSFDFHTQEED